MEEQSEQSLLMSMTMLNDEKFSNVFVKGRQPCPRCERDVGGFVERSGDRDGWHLLMVHGLDLAKVHSSRVVSKYKVVTKE